MARALRRHPEDPRSWAMAFLTGHGHLSSSEKGPIVEHMIAATADIKLASEPDPEEEGEDDFSL